MTRSDNLQNPVIEPFVTLIQLSDLHLTARAGDRLAGWDTWAALDTALEAISERESPGSLLLLTGDLVHDGQETAYHELARRLDATGRRYYAIPGNHDCPEHLYAALGDSRNRTLPLGARWTLQMLDSHRPGSDAGRLGQAQIEALEHRLKLSTESDHNTLLAVHHPPISTGSAWLDAIGLEDGAQLLNCGEHLAQNCHILCGHAHQALDTQHGSVRVLCCPSTNRQFTVCSTVFSADNKTPPGYRRLILRENGGIDTEIIRLADSRGHYQAR